MVGVPLPVMPPFWKRKRVAPVMDPDEELVERAVRPLWDTYCDGPECLTTEQATIMDVWSTFGAVLNGGLPEFIETEGQRGSHIVSAFRNIGLEDYADVVARTLRLYTRASR